MCDTMVALGNSTLDGSVLFAKNSDRQPNEPLLIIKVPRKKHNLKENKYLQATYIEIPQVEETHEVTLLKPAWIWGCEMGWNEFGLNIGNEAVFTKEKHGKDSLIGMDMVRLALERSKTAWEGLNIIIDLLAKYGQGGNCGYEKPFTYHNSFLLADPNSAWLLETAGKFWAAKKIDDVCCISNALTIGDDMDRCHPDLIDYAIDKGWCKTKEDFSFARCYTNKLITRFSGAKERRGACETALKEKIGEITPELLKKVLRSHHPEIKGKLYCKGSVKSVCMHAGGLVGDHTTGSYVARLTEDQCTYWVTGASLPCLSVFKPLWPNEDMPIFNEKQEKKALDYWLRREKLHRRIFKGEIDLPAYLDERDRLEKEIDVAVKEAKPKDHVEIMKHFFEKEEKLVGKYLAIENKKKVSGIKGSLYHRLYWRAQNKKLFAKQKD